MAEVSTNMSGELKDISQTATSYTRDDFTMANITVTPNWTIFYDNNSSLPYDGSSETSQSVGMVNLPFLIQMLLGIGIVLSNISILMVFRRYRPAGRSLNLLLQNLAVADLGMAVATFWRVGLVAWYGRRVEEVPGRCVPVIMLYIISAGVSISLLLLIAKDQWYSGAQNVSLEERQRWRKWSKRAIPAVWLLWTITGSMSMLGLRDPGRLAKAPCLVMGAFVSNLYWQIVGCPLLLLCALTVRFQWLSLRNARENTRNLLEALEQRHQGFMFLGGRLGGLPGAFGRRAPNITSCTLSSFVVSKTSAAGHVYYVKSQEEVSMATRLEDNQPPGRKMSGSKGPKLKKSFKRRLNLGQSSTAGKQRKFTAQDNNARPTTTKANANNDKISNRDDLTTTPNTSMTFTEKSGVAFTSRPNDQQSVATKPDEANPQVNPTLIKNLNSARHDLPPVEEVPPEVQNPLPVTPPLVPGKATIRTKTLAPPSLRASPLTVNAGTNSYEVKVAMTRLQLTRTLSIVMAVFTVCWFTYLPVSLILSACGDRCRTLFDQIAYLGTLAVGNSFMNAIIYTFRIKQYRVAIKKLLCRQREADGMAGQALNSVSPATFRDLALPPLY